MTRPGIEPRSPGPLANTLTAVQINYQHIYLTHKWDPNRSEDSGLEWTWDSWQWRADVSQPKATELYPNQMQFGVRSMTPVVGGSYFSEEDTITCPRIVHLVF